jgi:hypothetical protein
MKIQVKKKRNALEKCSGDDMAGIKQRFFIL